jgi:hypothetical protein
MMAAIVAPWGRLSSAITLGQLGTSARYGVAGCLSGLARFRRPGGRFLRQFVSRSRLFVDPDRLTASPGDAQGVRIVPIATPPTPAVEADGFARTTRD